MWLSSTFLFTFNIKKMYKSIVAARLLLIIFCFLCSWALGQSGQKINYINETELEKQINDNGVELLKTNQYRSFAQIKSEVVQLTENMQTVEKVNLLKTNAGKKLEGDVLYNQSKPGILVLSRCYKCANCERTHVIVDATAFAVSEDGVCVTNYHVLQNFIEKDTYDKGSDSLYYLTSSDNHSYPIEKILAYSKQGDVVIFKVNVAGNKLHPLQLGEPAETGSPVRAITNPTGFYYYYAEGVVSGNVQGDGEFSKIMEITADYAAGSSGGPILNQYGQVIGMVSTTRSVYYTYSNGTKDLQMVVKNTIPVTVIKQLINAKS